MMRLHALSLIAALLLSLPGMAAERMALVSIPVSCMRTAPAHAAEQSTQAVLGTPVQIIATQGDWLQVRTPDSYTGYMRSNTLHPLTTYERERWLSAQKWVVTAWLTRLYREDGTPYGYATHGSTFIATETEPDGKWLHIEAPDGSPLLIEGCDIAPCEQAWRTPANYDECVEEVIELAYTMLGAPYLWGGTSSLAPDCSGFTQIAYSAIGLLLPRDTSMQIDCGTKVQDISHARRGDLIFYGNKGRVNHVAIYLGDGKIIHSSGHVRVCRMYPSTEGDEELFTSTPMAIRRVIPQGDECVQGVSRLLQNPLYYSVHK